jgi:P-type Ca2+ transporter type 2C
MEVKSTSSWHSISCDDALTALSSDRMGLSGSEAAKRLEQYGKNELASEEKTSLLSIFLSQFANVLIAVLLVSATISLILGKQVESISIFVIVALAAVLGTLQEFQAGKALEALRKMASPSATVLRDGEATEVSSSDLVPGDVVIITYGNKVPADIRLLESNNLQLEEAALTGESLAVEKISEIIGGDSIPLGDRKNLLFMGTSVSNGRGRGVVVGTGSNTEFGKIATMLQNTKTEQTPLQKNLDKLGSNIGIIAIVVALALSVVSYLLSGGTILDAFIWAVALAVAIIPEALPAVVTIGLALGVQRMVRRKALIRKLPAVETLGAVNVVCTDKTGTLTKDEMTVRKIYADFTTFDVDGSGYSPEGNIILNGHKVKHDINPTLSKVLTYGVLCSDAELRFTDGWNVLGDPTEGAIITAAQKAKIDTDAIRRDNLRVEELPFSSDKKYMATAHTTANGKMVILKGAFEMVMGKCALVDASAGAQPLSAEVEVGISDTVAGFAANALRVIAVAYKMVGDSEPLTDEMLKDMVLAGFVAMIDPPREEVKPAIATCKRAGIRTIMITGDHKATAFAIAKELKIAQDESQVYSGADVEKMSQTELDAAVNRASVFARIAPEHKLRIVESLMKQGNVAAMTGDGVNDAPALKKANIGVAMGITGTDVSKEAADMILTDDNFVTIVAAVEEGRTIFENIKKFLIFLLSGNAGTVFAIMLAFAFGLALPLTAVQILFINFIMDGLIAIAISLEPAEGGIMHRKPRTVSEGIITRMGLLRIMSLGMAIALVTFAVYYVGVTVFRLPLVEAQTMFFLTLIFARLFNSLNNRSLNASIFKSKLLGNIPLVVSSVAGLAIVWATTKVGVLQVAFGNVDIGISGWLIAIGAGSLVLAFGEIFKMISRGKL